LAHYASGKWPVSQESFRPTKQAIRVNARSSDCVRHSNPLITRSKVSILPRDQQTRGLAALLLVLVVIVLLLRKPDLAQERVLKLCLYVGAFCLVATLLAQHFAPPDAQLQGQFIRLQDQLQVEKDQLQAKKNKPPPDYSKQKAVLGNVVKMFDPSVTALQEVNQMALDNGCPGGAHGIPIPHGGDIASRSSGVISNLGNAKSFIQSVIDSLPGTHT
jgi:hypothetical protein